jgi:hypothetical protein
MHAELGNAPLAGFETYGEIALGAGDMSGFHNTTTVEWRNEGRNRHNVLPDRGKRFGIDELERRATYSYRFDKPGRYGYYCSFHGTPGNGQFGRVKVVKAKRGSKG